MSWDRFGDSILRPFGQWSYQMLSKLTIKSQKTVGIAEFPGPLQAKIAQEKRIGIYFHLKQEEEDENCHEGSVGRIMRVDLSIFMPFFCFLYNWRNFFSWSFCFSSSHNMYFSMKKINKILEQFKGGFFSFYKICWGKEWKFYLRGQIMTGKKSLNFLEILKG